jgi:hypothetical protein
MNGGMFLTEHSLFYVPVSRYLEAVHTGHPGQSGTVSSTVVDWVCVAPTALLLFNYMVTLHLRARLFLQTLLQSFSTA